MEDAAACGHPLHVASRHLASIAQAIAVFNGTRENVSDGLDPTMRVPWEAGQVVVGIVVAEIVHPQGWVEVLGPTETEGALKLNSTTLDSRFWLNPLSD